MGDGATGRTTQERLQGVGSTIVVFSPAVSHPKSGHFWSTMAAIISALEACLD